MKFIKFNILLVLIASLALVTGCDDEESTSLPSVTTTTEVTNILSTTAVSGGNVNTDGGDNIIARGVCWGTSSNPTTANDTTMNGTGIGIFTSNLTGLTFSTKYYVRAYATNNVGTSYGSEITFTTLERFVGNYVINNAALSAALSITTNELGTIPIPAGTDITQQIQASLLSQVNCSSADKSWVELRKDYSMYMSCEGTNELNAGTWQEMSATELKLNMNSAAIPSSPTGFVLNVTEIVQTGDKMTGKTTVPLPKEMIAAMIAPLTLTPTSPPVYMVTFSLEFLKK